AAPACFVADILFAIVTDVITVGQHAVHERIATVQVWKDAIQLVKMLKKQQDRIARIDLRFQIIECKTAPKREVGIEISQLRKDFALISAKLGPSLQARRNIRNGRPILRWGSVVNAF